MIAFDSWLQRWSLAADGNPIRTPSSDLLPVLRGNAPAMLKIARTDEEQRGAAVLDWYRGLGAVRVLEIDGAAVLMERAACSRSLVEMVRTGRDDDATRILCLVIRQ